MDLTKTNNLLKLNSSDSVAEVAGQSDQEEKFASEEIADPEIKHPIVKVLKRVPWSIIPFVLSMFVLVESLDHVELLPIISDGMGYLCIIHPFVTIIIVTVVTTISANLLNNQPMTILFVMIFQHPVERS